MVLLFPPPGVRGVPAGPPAASVHGGCGRGHGRGRGRRGSGRGVAAGRGPRRVPDGRSRVRDGSDENSPGPMMTQMMAIPSHPFALHDQLVFTSSDLSSGEP